MALGSIDNPEHRPSSSFARAYFILQALLAKIGEFFSHLTTLTILTSLRLGRLYGTYRHDVSREAPDISYLQ